MQAFSYLQRKINDQDYLALGLVWLTLLVWESISNIYQYMPPLFGFAITGALIVRHKYYTIGLFAFLLFFEADHSYFLFSTWLYFMFHTNFLIPVISSLIDCKKCLLITSVVLGYILYYTFLHLLETLLLEHTSAYNIYLISVYIAIESLLIFVTAHAKK
mgnify:CR=1 FL=1